MRDAATAEWFAVKDSLDPKSLDLDMRKLKTEDGVDLLTGLFISDVDNRIYPLYAAPLGSAADIPLFSIAGKLHYNPKRGEYIISDNDPTDRSQYQGAVLSLRDSSSSVAFHGPMSFITNTKNYSIAASGVGSGNPDSARYRVRALLGIDADMPAKAVELMASTLSKATKNSAEAFDGSIDDMYNIAQFAGNKGVETFNNRRPGMAPPPLATISPKLQHTVTLSKVELRWNSKLRAWYSVGKIGLAGIGKQGLNALVDGYVEIKRENSADLVEVYLEAEPQTWVYLRYANNVLLTKSSSEEYDGEIAAKQKGGIETAADYGAFLGEYEDVDRFRAHFERTYLGKSGKLAPRPTPPAGSTDSFGTETGKKKKKKDNDPFGDGVITPASDPTTEPAKKSKKKKDDDPFGDGVITPAADPAAEPDKKSKKKAKEEAPAADPMAEPAPEPTKKSKKKKDNDPFADSEIAPPIAPAPKPTTPPTTTPASPAATPAPVAEPAATSTPEPAPDKKEKAREAEPDPSAEPGVETDKKSKKKKKKAEANDPFGDS